VSLGHFGTGAELSQHFVKGPKCPTDISALVPKCLGQIGGAFGVHVLVSLHHLTLHLHHPSRSSDSVSRHFVYTKSYPDIHIWLI